MDRCEEIATICTKLSTLWALHPEQRFGQLLENYLFPSVQTKNPGRASLTWFQEDKETLAKLEELTDVERLEGEAGGF